jgi:hypothetical protein
MAEANGPATREDITSSMWTSLNASLTSYHLLETLNGQHAAARVSEIEKRMQTMQKQTSEMRRTDSLRYLYSAR